MNRTRTTHVRIYKDMDDELKRYFPGVRSADLLKTMYNTSAVKIERVLREISTKKK